MSGFNGLHATRGRGGISDWKREREPDRWSVGFDQQVPRGGGVSLGKKWGGEITTSKGECTTSARRGGERSLITNVMIEEGG